MQDLETLKEYFMYDEESPSCLTRKKAVYSGRLYTTLTVSEGAFCGSLKEGYWVVKIQQKAVFCHRIIWALHYGEFGDGFEIDHINGDTSDNRIENLRLVDHKTNCQNRALRKDSKTGVTGVTYTPDGLKYRARWTINNKHYHKTFTDLEEARACREKMLQLANQLGENYTERHGL